MKINNIQNFSSKTHIISNEIIRNLIGCKTGERIASIASIASELNCGHGLVQTIFNDLQDNNSIKIHKQGHLGSYLEDIDDIKLLSYLGKNELLGTLPLLYSDKYRELSNNIYATFNNKPAIYLAYIRGAISRIELLIRGHFDFTIVSHKTAQSRIQTHNDIEIVHNFAPNSYASGHGVVFTSDRTKLEDGMVVGIDNESLDHIEIVNDFCSENSVKLEPVYYYDLISKMKNKELDAVIWSIDGLSNFTNKYIPIETAPEYRQATLIISKEKQYIKRLFLKLLQEKKDGTN
ncbi:MAG: hypothetical protein LBQ34_05545 [Alphaproteobacteria bacterium]|jgi:hypothetical protein|nr:hypothetical protein [Alphaproteobacteria bacterium]